MHHRDFWDVKDMLGLVPGVGLLQWISGRVAARTLGLISRFLVVGKAGGVDSPQKSGSRSPSDPFCVLHNGPLTERGHLGGSTHEPSSFTPAANYRTEMRNALGLEGVEPLRA